MTIKDKTWDNSTNKVSNFLKDCILRLAWYFNFFLLYINGLEVCTGTQAHTHTNWFRYREELWQNILSSVNNLKYIYKFLHYIAPSGMPVLILGFIKYFIFLWIFKKRCGHCIRGSKLFSQFLMNNYPQTNFSAFRFCFVQFLHTFRIIRFYHEKLCFNHMGFSWLV